MPANVAIRTLISVVAAALLYIVYYKVSHLFLGTQKGFSHPQQFPMIPMIWLVNIMLVHHWFMDNWPMWKMVPKTTEQIEQDHLEEKRTLAEEAPTPSYGWGIGAGVMAGVAVYFLVLAVLPAFYSAISVIY